MAVLPRQPITIPFGGINTKADPKVVGPGNSLRLEDAEFDVVGAISTRNGYTALTAGAADGSTISSASSLALLKDSLILFNGVDLYAFRTTPDKWQRKYTVLGGQAMADAAVAMRTSTVDVAATAAGQGFDVGYASGFALYAWRDTTVKITVVDIDTGSEVYSSESVSAMTGDPRVAVSNGIIYVVAIDRGGATLRMCSFNPSTATLSAASTLQTNASTSAAAGMQFDVAPFGNDVVCSYASSVPDIRTFTFNTSGVSIAAVTVAETIAADSSLGVCVDSSGPTVFVAYRQTATNNIRTFARTSSLSSSYAAATMETLAGSTRFVGVVSGLTQYWFYDVTTTNNEKVRRTTMNTSGGAAVSQDVLRSVTVAAKPLFLSSSRIYLLTRFRSGDTTVSTQLQGAYFLINGGASLLQSTSVVAKFLADRRYDDTTVRWVSSLASLGSSAYLMAGLAQQVQTSKAGTAAPIVTGLRFDLTGRMRTATLGGRLYFGGGVLQQYDGKQVVEAGFHVFPDYLTTSTGAGATIAAGTYQFSAVYAWFDAKGRLETSAPVPAATLVLGGAVGSITLTVPSCRLSAKSDAFVLFYGTQDGNTTLYEIGATVNSRTTDTVTCTITAAPAATGRLLYTGDGTLEHTAAPVPQAIVAWRNRLAVYGQDGRFWYSNALVDGECISFSDALTLEVPRNREAWQLAVMDERLIGLAEGALYYMDGEGANRLGYGASLTGFLAIASESGALPYSPVAVSDLGLYFKSLRGICLLNRAHQVQYVGAPVERYNTLTLVSAVLVSDKSQIRFGHSDGVALVLDQVTGQWATFSNHSQEDAVMWGATYCMLKSSGVVWQQSTGFTDGDGALVSKDVESPWIALPGLEGSQRLYWLQALGEYKSPHKLRVRIYHDHDDSVTVEDVEFDATTGYTAGQPLRGRHHSGRRCTAVKVRLTDKNQTGTGESSTLTALMFEVGAKKGAHRLKTTQTV